VTTAELGNGERQVVIPRRLRPPANPRGKSVTGLGGETMGTTWSVKLAHAAEPDCERLRCGIERVLARIVAQMSNWDGGSDLSRFNRAGAGSWLPLPADFHVVLDYALALAEDTGGAYDPTVGPLVDLWGFGPAGMRADPPRESDIETARARCGHRKLRLDRKARCVLQPGGVSLDLCGIAKGYAVDCVASLLHKQGHRDYLVEIGGELRGEGEKPDGSPWWVALEAPRDCADTGSRTIVALHGLGVATSGDYRRYFEHQGVRYAHSIDPRCGHPVGNGVLSVTVLHRSCMRADALATALMVLGVDAGLQFAAARNIAALFVFAGRSGLQCRGTPAFTAMAA
jgi:FAD:protein FMN transferase